MSKIIIEQVDRLDEERKTVKYGDLEAGTFFITPQTDWLRIKTISGHISFTFNGKDGAKEVDHGWGDEDEVIPVKAKILWCREDGE